MTAPAFPDTPFSEWNEEDKNRFLWLLRIGVKTEWAGPVLKEWLDDYRPDPVLHDTLCYRVKQ